MLGVATIGVTPAAALPPAPIVDPPVVATGGSFTVSGTGCFDPRPGSLAGVIVENNALGSEQELADANGNWQVTFTDLNGYWQPGSYTLESYCVDQFQYPDASVAVGSAPPAGSRYFAVTPKRLLDSRPGSQVGPFATPWGAGQTRDLTVVGGSTGVPADATAVVLNVTGVLPSAATHVTVWPTGEALPTASNLNLPAGSVRPNLVTAKVGAGGQVSLHNSSGTMHLLADLAGYFAPATSGGLYNGIAPQRFLDTRDGTGGFTTPWGAGQTRNVTVAGGSTPVPADATAVVLNVTATGPSAPSHLTVWPTGQTRPDTSNLNYSTGETVANLVAVEVGTNAQVSGFNNDGTVHLIVDVIGYYTGSAGATFTPVSPKRLLDSRPGSQVGPYATPWAPDQTRDLTVAGGSTTVPADATAVVVNVTGVFPTAATHLTVWSAGQAMPPTSNLNLPAGDVRPNLVIVDVGASQEISVFNNSGEIDVLADVAGYYTTP